MPKYPNFDFFKTFENAPSLMMCRKTSQHMWNVWLCPNETFIIHSENIKNPEMFFSFKENKFSSKIVTMGTTAFFIIIYLQFVSSTIATKNNQFRYLNQGYNLWKILILIKSVFGHPLPWQPCLSSFH